MTTYPPPAVPVFPDGYAPGPSDFDSWVQAPLGGLTYGVVFRAQQTSNQALSTSGFSTLTFDTVLEDPWGGWNAAINQWSAPFTGWYAVTVSCSVSTASVQLQVAVGLSNVSKYATTDVTVPGAVLGGSAAWAKVPMSGGNDFITGLAGVSGAASTDVSAPGRYPSIEISFENQ